MFSDFIVLKLKPGIQVNDIFSGVGDFIKMNGAMK